MACHRCGGFLCQQHCDNNSPCSEHMIGRGNNDVWNKKIVGKGAKSEKITISAIFMLKSSNLV